MDIISIQIRFAISFQVYVAVNFKNKPYTLLKIYQYFIRVCSYQHAKPLFSCICAYGVYISQLIRYARASSNYSDFLHYMKMHRLLSSLQRRNIFRQDRGIGI
jgi:hypothetical protein